MEQTRQAPPTAEQVQWLYDRFDMLSDACHNIRCATEALEACRDMEQAENLAALEDIGGALARDRDVTQAQLERLEAMERAALAREVRE